MRSSPFLNAPAAGVADPAACHGAEWARGACMTRVQAQGRRKVWSTVLMNEGQNQQKRHHRHVDFTSNDSQVSTRTIHATASIWKRALAESNRWNDSTLRLLPTLANGPLIIQTRHLHLLPKRKTVVSNPPTGPSSFRRARSCFTHEMRNELTSRRSKKRKDSKIALVHE